MFYFRKTESSEKEMCMWEVGFTHKELGKILLMHVELTQDWVVSAE
jgi:hypothetical protein